MPTVPTRQNLTNDPAYDGWPAWSPDGTKIAFASNRRGNHRIYVMDADGKNVLPIVHDEGRATAPTWTPDGKSIYFPICARKDGIAGCEIFSGKALSGQDAQARPATGAGRPHRGTRGTRRPGSSSSP